MKVRHLEGVGPLRQLAIAVVAMFACVMSYTGGWTSPACAHDIPADVKINAFLKPAGNRLELLVRLPLASLIDTDFPMRGAFLDLALPRSRHSGRREDQRLLQARRQPP